MAGGEFRRRPNINDQNLLLLPQRRMKFLRRDLVRRRRNRRMILRCKRAHSEDK